MTAPDPREVLTGALESAASRGLSLRPATAVLDDTGWDFRVVMVQDTEGADWILRLPRRSRSADRIAAEAAVLAAVRPVLPVAVPRWEHADRAFIAYRRLGGVPAGAEDPAGLRYEWHPAAGCGRPGTGYVTSLGSALAALHRMPVEEAVDAGIPPREPGLVREELARTLADARTAVPLPEPWYAHWRAWLDDERHWTHQARLTHGDMHPGHTLVGPGSEAVTGVLDWTNAAFDDPAADFVDQYLAGGGPLLDRLLSAYRRGGGTVQPGLRERVLLRASFRWAHVGLLGARTGRPAFTAVARDRLAAPPPEPGAPPEPATHPAPDPHATP
ncbi:macrolide 2'-phosphotransferase [Streptomyces sp. LP11]|uniref:Macrolide 2'-phosphotransferase n=1 Tax=Streptomyces pyxinicus TaxID=2970331 RepID=A0ABT2AY73_9ACTN|nr:macrolide 2'-phosphotransferase [Streptomyces sp. LP11]MCS0600840.1 macrolide 2'-phosphotransferase [Streptomyces sp. LP11]